MTFKSCVVPQQVHCTKQGHHISYRQQRRKINSITKWIYPPKHTHSHTHTHAHTHTHTHSLESYSTRPQVLTERFALQVVMQDREEGFHEWEGDIIHFT